MSRSLRVWHLIIWVFLLSCCIRANAVEFSTVEFKGKRVTVCRVNIRQEHLELFYRDDKGRPFKRFDRLSSWLKSRGHRLVFAMNAGMYHPDFSAVGLLVSNERQMAPLNTGNAFGNFFLKPNGVFALTESGARVVETSVYSKIHERVLLATQSGPLLVNNGKIHPAFKPTSDSRLYRNAVGVPSPDVALFVITETPFNFYEIATLFRDKLKCPNALFLDGSISSLYSIELHRDDFRMDLGPIIGTVE